MPRVPVIRWTVMMCAVALVLGAQFGSARAETQQAGDSTEEMP
jgi:hypothetical protein